MAETMQIRFCGFGGQGIVLAGTILGQAAIKDGKWVAGSNAYGAAARGGNCRADVVISNEPIVYPHVIKADVLVAMSQSAYDSDIKDTSDTGLVIYDEELVSPRKTGKQKIKGIPASSVAIKELNSGAVANMVILGATVALTGVTSKESLISALEEGVAERFKALNLKAIEVGFRLAKKNS